MELATFPNPKKRKDTQSAQHFQTPKKVSHHSIYNDPHCTRQNQFSQPVTVFSPLRTHWSFPVLVEYLGLRFQACV